MGPAASVTREREKGMEGRGTCLEQGYHDTTTIPLACLPNAPQQVSLPSQAYIDTLAMHIQACMLHARSNIMYTGVVSLVVHV